MFFCSFFYCFLWDSTNTTCRSVVNLIQLSHLSLCTMSNRSTGNSKQHILSGSSFHWSLLGNFDTRRSSSIRPFCWGSHGTSWRQLCLGRSLWIWPHHWACRRRWSPGHSRCQTHHQVDREDSNIYSLLAPSTGGGQEMVLTLYLFGQLVGTFLVPESCCWTLVFFSCSGVSSLVKMWTQIEGWVRRDLLFALQPLHMVESELSGVSFTCFSFFLTPSVEIWSRLQTPVRLWFLK